MEQKKKENDWVKIFTTQQEHRATLVQIMLQENEVQCVKLNKQDSTYGFGEIELYALREQVIKALHLIKKHNE